MMASVETHCAEGEEDHHRERDGGIEQRPVGAFPARVAEGDVEAIVAVVVDRAGLEDHAERRDDDLGAGKDASTALPIRQSHPSGRTTGSIQRPARPRKLCRRCKASR